jgi:hypothetical protein
VIAVYGLLDEKSDASVHRSLSELTPIFDHPRYGKNVLLGGDLNIFANPRRDDPARARHDSVLQRLGALGMTSCLAVAKRPRRSQLIGCPCRDPGCRHQRTYLGHATDEPYEEDFLFMSKALKDKLHTCEVVEGIASSDHAPLKATFKI